MINLLTPNDNNSGHTAPLTSKRFILYIYSTIIDTEYFKHCIYSPFFPLQNAFIILTYLVPVLFTFYIQCALNLKNNSGAKRLIIHAWFIFFCAVFQFCIYYIDLHNLIQYPAACMAISRLWHIMQ